MTRSVLFGASEPARALVIAPHADDEVLEAGGTIARLLAEGWRVHVLFGAVAGYRSLISGETSTDDERRREAEGALAVLGGATFNTICADASWSLRLDQVAQIELIEGIEAAIRSSEPCLCLIPCHDHYNQDHRALAEAATAALRPAAGSARWAVPVVLAYGHALPGWSDPGSPFMPSVFVDIEGVLGTKLEALACYASQVTSHPHHRSPEAIRAQALYWGGAAGLAAAEPFACLRWIA